MLSIETIINQISNLVGVSNLSVTDFQLARKMAKELNIDWKNPNLRILDRSCGKATILLAFIEQLQKYHSNEHIAKNMIYGYDVDYIQFRIASKAIKLALGSAPNIYCEDSLRKTWTMNFDVSIGNPPFSDRSSNSDNSANLDNLFVLQSIENSKIVKMILRSKHFYGEKSKFRRKLFGSGKVASIEYIDPTHFKTIDNTPTCILTYDHNHSGPTTIVCEDGSVRQVMLNEDSIILLRNPDIVRSVENNMEYRWQRGKIPRNRIVDDPNGDEVIEIMGKAKTPPTIRRATPGLETTAVNCHGVVMNINQDHGALSGKMIVKPYGAAICNSIIILKTENDDEAERLIKYLRTTEVKEIIKNNMGAFSATKSLFSKIPDMPKDFNG
jgi:predicted RNA methylase